jgi:hypothetical protein
MIYTTKELIYSIYKDYGLSDEICTKMRNRSDKMRYTTLIEIIFDHYRGRVSPISKHKFILN